MDKTKGGGGGFEKKNKFFAVKLTGFTKKLKSFSGKKMNCINSFFIMLLI